MPSLAEPDLIINPDGSVYHICMRPEDLADTVIVVGDPQRVHEISDHFTAIDHRASNREFISHTGYYNGKRITALDAGTHPSAGRIAATSSAVSARSQSRSNASGPVGGRTSPA